MLSLSKLSILTLFSTLAGQAVALPLASASEPVGMNSSAAIWRRDGDAQPPLSAALGTEVPYVRFVIPASLETGARRVIEHTWCIEKSEKQRKKDRHNDKGWNFPLAWNTLQDQNDGRSHRLDCQTFIIQPYLWRENWFWIQVSDATIFRAWNQQAPGITFADPIGQLDQQFNIECKEVLPDDKEWFAKDCQVVFLSKSRDVDGCLFANSVTDLKATNKPDGWVRGGSCNEDVHNTDVSRFHLARAVQEFAT